MTGEAMITITGHQPDVTDEATIETAQGNCDERNGHIFIRFTNEEVRTLIKITGDSLTVTRSGAYNSQMCFISGEETSSVYQTPLGSFDTVIRTHAIGITRGAASMQVRIIYDLTMNDVTMKKCDLILDVKALR